MHIGRSAVKGYVEYVATAAQLLVESAYQGVRERAGEVRERLASGRRQAAPHRKHLHDVAQEAPAVASALEELLGRVKTVPAHALAAACDAAGRHSAVLVDTMNGKRTPGWYVVFSPQILSSQSPEGREQRDLRSDEIALIYREPVVHVLQDRDFARYGGITIPADHAVHIAADADGLHDALVAYFADNREAAQHDDGKRSVRERLLGRFASR